MLGSEMWRERANNGVSYCAELGRALSVGFGNVNLPELSTG